MQHCFFQQRFNFLNRAQFPGLDSHDRNASGLPLMLLLPLLLPLLLRVLLLVLLRLVWLLLKVGLVVVVLTILILLLTPCILFVMTTRNLQCVRLKLRAKKILI